MINVSWNDAQLYVDWLNARTGGNFRLPSEAEWEYVARAGSTTEYSWGNDIGHDRANCNGCGSLWDGEMTAPVGSFPANAWGLHDMHGNVWEWVKDCSDNSCSERVVRGGSWSDIPRYLRSAFRAWSSRTVRYFNQRFRLAQDL